MLFFSRSTRGFYDLSIHNIDNIPKDVVEITEEYKNYLMEAQSQGLIIESDNSGKPIIKKKEDLTPEDKKLLVDQNRARAYACSTTGSDRYFLEVLSLMAGGEKETSNKVKGLRKQGLDRKIKIKLENPWE